MSARDLHVLRNAVLSMHQGTLYINYKEGEELVKKAVPIEKVGAVYAEGSVTVKAGAAKTLMKRGVPVHFFSGSGSYLGTLWPRERLLAGEVIIKQAEHYLDHERRMFLARRFVLGSALNMLKNLEYYERQGADVVGAIEGIRGLMNGIDSQGSISTLMALEGNIRELYYDAWNSIMPEGFRFSVRTRRPPRSMLDALISFGNSLTYAACLTEIYHTQLNPTISYLHEPSERRFSLALDISEVFKPVLADRTVFRLVRQDRIDEGYFERELDGILLNDAGKRKFVEAFEEKLSTTVELKSVGRSVSYRRLIRLEAYKLVKHVLGMGEYRPLEMDY